jgi:hypothetical protein
MILPPFLVGFFRRGELKVKGGGNTSCSGVGRSMIKYIILCTST